MKLNIAMTAVAASALMSGAALAQAADPTGVPAPAIPVISADQTTTVTTTAPAPTGQATTTSVTASDPATGTTVTSSMVSNGPVPDTAENRAKYGGPVSHAGKHTAPKGN